MVRARVLSPDQRTLLTVQTLGSRPRGDSDCPGACSAFAAKDDFNAQRAQPRLRSSQSAGERARTFGKPGPSTGTNTLSYKDKFGFVLPKCLKHNHRLYTNITL